MLNALKLELEQRKTDGLLRQRRLLDSPQAEHIVVNGKNYLSFCSNDYLGLANHPALIKTMQNAAADSGVGSGASNLITGHHRYHDELEKKLAKFVQMPAALVFSTGYMANIGVVSSLVGRGDAVFCDKLNHACLNDGAILSRAEFKRFAHNDVAALEKLLKNSSAKRKLIAVDAVFSMDGDIAPLPAYLRLCEQYDAYLYVDDAHGFGVLGERGQGTISHFADELDAVMREFGADMPQINTPSPQPSPTRGEGVKSHLQATSTQAIHKGAADVVAQAPRLQAISPRIIYMATLGKAAGVAGAFVAGQQVVIDYLIQNARSYVYSTPAPPALSATLIESVNLIEKGDHLRTHLQHLIATLKQHLQLKNWQLMPSNTAVQPLIVGSNHAAVSLSEHLQSQGILVPAIRPPTVPINTARLRISLSAAHSLQDVIQLAKAINQAESELA
jgi:8-amino-7-oxononanoate synthase